jgi:hypothetical protein
MRFHEYRTLWSEMQGQLPRQVTEERFYATAMATSSGMRQPRSRNDHTLSGED